MESLFTQTWKSPVGKQRNQCKQYDEQIYIREMDIFYENRTDECAYEIC